jgi:hypothetical protein
MGMDVYGDDPSSEVGEYFRNNVWFWRPLWDYCLTHHSDIAGKVQDGHSNVGDGLNSKDSYDLGMCLKSDIARGDISEYEKSYNDALAELPEDDCRYCGATGQRDDKYVTGQCNACGGKGRVKNINAWYSFTSQNVYDFSEFLVNCGGFKIF